MSGKSPSSAAIPISLCQEVLHVVARGLEPASLAHEVRWLTARLKKRSEKLVCRDLTNIIILRKQEKTPFVLD